MPANPMIDFLNMGNAQSAPTAPSTIQPQSDFMKKILGLLAQNSNLNDDAGRQWLASQGANIPTTQDSPQINPDSAAKSGYMNSQWWLGDDKNPMPAIDKIQIKDGNMTITSSPMKMYKEQNLLAAKLEAERKKLGMIGMKK